MRTAWPEHYVCDRYRKGIPHCQASCGQFVLVGNIIESQFLTSGDWNFGSAISLIMAIIIMLSMWLTRKVDVQPASRGKE